jgi:hypothetical protein
VPGQLLLTQFKAVVVPYLEGKNYKKKDLLGILCLFQTWVMTSQHSQYYDPVYGGHLCPWDMASKLISLPLPI